MEASSSGTFPRPQSHLYSPITAVVDSKVQAFKKRWSALVAVEGERGHLLKTSSLSGSY